MLAAVALSELESFDGAARSKKRLRAAIEHVAARLGNTPTICRKRYVHPEVLNSYLDGTLAREMAGHSERILRNKLEGLEPEEAVVLALLRARLKAASNGSVAHGPKGLRSRLTGSVALLRRGKPRAAARPKGTNGRDGGSLRAAS